MSDAATPQIKHDENVSADSAASVNAVGKPTGGFALAVLALLVGLAGAAAAGWSLWQLKLLQGAEAQQTHALALSREESATRMQQLAARLDTQLAALPSAVELDERRRMLATVQGDQQRLSQRLQELLDGNRQQWRLEEAEHLLRLASLRLSALQDVDSAQALVSAADDILRDQNDPAAFAARAQLSASLEALRTTVRPDRAGLFLQLAALRDQATLLTPLAPDFEGNADALTQWATENDPQAWWAQWLRKAGQYFRIEFDAEDNVRPLLSGQSLAQIRLSLSLALEQAQWATLNGYSSVYQQSLKQAEEILANHFNSDNPESRALTQRISELAKADIDMQVPDLSPAFTALQRYLERKHVRQVPQTPVTEEAP